MIRTIIAAMAALACTFTASADWIWEGSTDTLDDTKQAYASIVKGDVFLAFYCYENGVEIFAFSTQEVHDFTDEAIRYRVDKDNVLTMENAATMGDYNEVLAHHNSGNTLDRDWNAFIDYLSSAKTQLIADTSETRHTFSVTGMRGSIDAARQWCYK